MDIGFIFVYSLFTILQIFILLSSGMISFIKGIYTADSLKKLSLILLNLFFPVQGMLEIARMATPENVQIFWIMVITVTFSMFLGFFIGLFLNWVFKLDVRIKYSYSLILAIPSLGTLPLVLGKAFCYPGGPLEGDPQCANMLGYMNINSLIFNLILFISGFKLIITDKNFAEEIEMKLGYIWPLVCDRLYNGKNYAVLRLFEKYMKKLPLKNSAELEFEKFDSELRLVNIPGEACYELKDAKGELKFYEKNDSVNKQSEQSEPLQERRDVSQQAAYLDNNNKDYEFNISKQIENQEIENERRRKESVNKSNQSYFQGKSITDKSYEQRIQKISIDENDLQLSIREIEIAEGDEENKENEIPQEQQSFKEALAPEAYELQPIKNESPKNVFSEQNLNVDKLIEENGILNTEQPFIQKSEEAQAKRKIKKSGSIRVSKINFDNLFEGVKNYIGVQTFSDFKTYVGKFIKINHNKLIKKLSKHKEEVKKEKQRLDYLQKINKYETDLIVHEEHKHLKKNDLHEKNKKLITNDYKNFLNHKLNIIRRNTFNLERNPIMFYFEKLFEKIEEFRFKPSESGFDLHEDNIYHIEKITILIHLHGQEFKDDPDLKEKRSEQIYKIKEKEEKKLLQVYFDHEHPPSFPIARGLNLTEENIEKIRSIWSEFDSILKKNFSDFSLVIKKEPADFTLVLNKIYSPILLGSILGLVIGLSGMRDVLFSPNHYIQNLVEGILVISKAAVPFLYISVGVQFLTMQKIDLNMTLSKKHIVISLIHRYIIIPGIGLLWVYIWTNYYGGVVKESKVFRISLFIPFCVPCSANISMLVNLILYFKEETSLILLVQNLAMLVGLTILYLVYFIVVGS